MRIDHESPVEPGRKFAIGLFRPEDAAGVASLFYSIYGPQYPFDTYYYPERITEENKKGNIHSIVARTPKGDVIGHAALYRSSPPNPNLLEAGQYMVHKQYRNSTAAYRLAKFLEKELIPRVAPNGVFGEALCTHITSQKGMAMLNFKDVALELDQLPPEMYEMENVTPTGRISCLVQFLSHHDRPHEVFIPAAYGEQIRFILRDPDISRTLTVSNLSIPQDSATEFSKQVVKQAGVLRTNIKSAGADLEMIMRQIEEQAESEEIAVTQLFISLEKPWVSAAIELLRQRGYFFCGYVPRWFDSDGILMQKISSTPDFGAIALYSDKAKKILEYVHEDWTRATVSR
ncbi:MAG: hypothetical protein AB9866_09920 [Syntrophobacteraceae bacterium]